MKIMNARTRADKTTLVLEDGKGAALPLGRGKGQRLTRRSKKTKIINNKNIKKNNYNWLLLGPYWALLGPIGSYWALLGPIGPYWVPWGGGRGRG